MKFDVHRVDRAHAQVQFDAACDRLPLPPDGLKMLRATLPAAEYDAFVESDDFFKFHLRKAAAESTR